MERTVLFTEKEKYREHLHNISIEYENKVLSGEVIASEWIKLAVIREQGDRERFEFRKDKVDLLFDFCFYVYLNVKSKVTQFVPSPYQAWMFRSIYGLYYPGTEKRVRRFAVMTTSRKSGKTAAAAILSLFSMMKEERSAEVYFAATTQFQASQALRYLKDIVIDSPALNKRVDRLQYSLRFTGNGTCIAKPLANCAERLDGLSPSFAIIDESAALPDKTLFNILKTGTLARNNPLIIQISTAGHNKDYPFYSDLELGKQVLNGDVQDDSTFYAIYQLDNEGEIENPEMWVKSNPNIDVVIDLQDLKNDWNKAKLIYSDRNEFIVKNLNVYTDSTDTWIPDEDYKKCFKPVDVESLKGAEAFVGIDLSATTDIASMVIVVKDEDGRFKIIPEFHLPNGSGMKRVRAGDIDLSEWVKKGYLFGHSGKTIDYSFIIERLEYWNEFFDIQMIGFDPWNSAMFIQQLEDTFLTEQLIKIPQNTKSFNTPMKYIEALILSENISLSTNPVLRWMFRNVVLYIDGNGNIKPVKNKSADSIDGVVSLIMAIGLCIGNDFTDMTDLIKHMNKLNE